MAGKSEKLNREDFLQREPTPGELYGQISISERDLTGADQLLVMEKPNWFVKFCKNINIRFPSLGAGAKWQPKYKEAIDFLGWKISAQEISAGIKFVMFVSVILAIVAGIILYFLIGDLLANLFGIPLMVPIIIFGPLIIAAFGATTYIQGYPSSAAKQEQVKALTYVAEIVGYLIMSIKLVPNLEKAIEFAAKHGRGKIAEDFKKLLWDVQLGNYTTLSEGLDALAYKWGNFSSEFKHALMRIRASVIENSEAKRYAVLDHTMEEILASIKGKMEDYARSLSEPSVLLFYVGVLLPLILIIILPVGSTFSGAPLANPLVLFLIYDVVIPAVTFIFALTVVRTRPPTYVAPKIPDNYPGLPKKWSMKLGKQQLDLRMLMAIVLIAGLSVSFYLGVEGIPPKVFMENPEELQLVPAMRTVPEVLKANDLPDDYFDEGASHYFDLLAQEGSQEAAIKRLDMERQLFFMQPNNDVTPSLLVFGILITLSLVAFVYLNFTSVYKRKIQLEIMEMESEFKDSLYVLASRMGENKPVEEALKYTMEFLPKLKVSQTIFARTIENISLLGMPLETAVFDKSYGSLRDMPSPIIRGTMRLMIDSVQLGVNVAARTLMSLSMQLTNAEEVNKTLRTLISEVSGMMRSMGMIIAPIVLGITTGLQKIVVITISNIAGSDVFSSAGNLSGVEGLPGGFSSYEFSGMMNPEALAGIASPTQFVFMVAAYIVMLVLIMTFFISRLEEDNDLLLRMNIAKALPISVAIFVVSMIATNALLAGFSF